MSMQALSSLLGLSFTSGINLYAAVLTVGLVERYGLIQGLPPELHVFAHPAILILAGLLYAAEFVADKVPFFTPIWDGVHTFIRPAGGALLALASTSNLDPLVQAGAMLLGGTLALGTHTTKMGARLIAHTAPEPISHSAISVGEDIGVVAIVLLALSHPFVAVPLLVGLIVATALMLPMLMRVLNFIMSGIWGRLASLWGPAATDALPPWMVARVAELVPGANRPVLRCFARRVRGVPRLQEGFLVCRVPDGSEWQFVFRRFLRVKVAPLDTGRLEDRSLDVGLIYDGTAIQSDKARSSFFLTKDWSRVLQERIGRGDADAV